MYLLRNRTVWTHDRGALVLSHRKTMDRLVETVDDESCPTAPAMREVVERLITEVARHKMRKIKLNPT